MNRMPMFLTIVLVLFFFVGTSEMAYGQLPVPVPSPGVTITQFGPGVSYPRGLKFGPDGYLYVAESGPGGNASTAGLCSQVPGPPDSPAGPGPWTGGNNGRVSKISPAGVRTTVADNFPSTFSEIGGSMGVADVEFFNGQLYALVAGGGCSHGHANPADDNQVARINSDGTYTMFANISSFVKNNETANPEPDDYEPDGTPYSMVSAKGSLFVVEPNHGQVIAIDSNGNMSRFIDISAIFGHIVPTAMAYHGNLYVSNLSTFPIVPGSAQIMKITSSGKVSVVAKGLTTVLGIAFDADGNMYALEMSDAPGFPGPGNAKIIKIRGDGSPQTIVSGLSLATGLTFGPDGALYVSNWGFGPPFGQILRVTLPTN